MAADLARITYDPTRQYRSVIAQQGRVTLEADNNEAATIATEALRLETIDLIGATGTPDDGYKVGSGTGPGGVSIGPGVFYLGGWRLEFDAQIDLSSQPDWLDALTTPVSGSGNLLVALLLTEQSVCAVEDQALREVALGGPDSAARMRLMQHFLRLSVSGDTCADGAAAIGKLLAADGVTVDATLQLQSAATLLAGFVPGPPNTDPCQPVAAGGYLGADNQLVRVTVIDYDATKHTGTLLWGWNNASILCRAGMTDPLTLTLTGTPVDEEHAPQLGQAVEILRSQADLTAGNFIAAPEGFVTTLAQAYSFDTGAIALNDALPAEYQTDKNPLFVRLWQATVPFNAGQVTALDSTSGITVTISLPVLPTTIALRPFWRFAVRPSTPVTIYPQPYSETPQLPDGPRQWLADLAVVQAQASGSKLLADCRVPFLPLTQQGGKCCSLVLGPNEVAWRGGLQAMLDGLAGTKSSVALLAGSYPLAVPILLGKQHSGLTLEACGPGAVLTASASDLTPFLFGLVVIEAATDITLRGLEFQMPNVPLGTGDAKVQPTWSVGIGAGAATGLTVENCSFAASPASAYVFGAGLLLIGDGTDLTVRWNSFVASSYVPGSMVFGVLATVVNANVSTSLDNAEISDNLFQRLAAGVTAFSQLGFVRCSGNRVVGCGTGLFFAASNLGTTTEVARQALANTAQQSQNLALSQAVNSGLQATMLAQITSKAAQFAAKAPQPTAPTVSEVARNVLAQDIATRGSAAWSALVTSSGTQPAGTAPAAAAPVAAAAETTMQSLQMVNEISIAAEVAGYIQTPVLHIAGNDVTLASTGTTPGVGIGIVFSPRDESGTVLLTANRVTTQDTGTAAAAILFPTIAAVTGNVLIQTGSTTGTVAPSFALLAERTAAIEVTANVIHASAIVFPPRNNTAPVTNWNILNTTG